MSRIDKGRGLLRTGVAVVAAGSLGLGATAAGSAAASAPAGASHARRGHALRAHKVQGGTAYFAEQAGAPPNYIFPFEGGQFDSVNNVSQFQYLMYRPLYWFGKGASPQLNPALSIAKQPVYSHGNTVVSFALNHYKWSDGETVTPQDVVFFMNMLKVEKLVYDAYSAGSIPDDIKSITTTGDSVTIDLTGPVNPYWFTENELGQITPMPMAWDVTGTGQKRGSASCGTASYQAVVVKTVSGASPSDTPVSAAAKSCAAVYTFMSKESGYDPTNPKAPNNALSTYATNPLWQVVDGPWHLASFTSTGYVAMKPNPDYSGPVKPTLAEFVELPYTSASSEFNALVAGKVSVGFLPPEDVTATAPSPTTPGANNPRLSNFNIAPWYPWGINYFPYNFNSTGDGGQAGKIFRQLYFREAFQTLVDQPLYIKKLFHNYAVPTYGPVPVLPKNSFATSFEETNHFPYNVKKAISLLKTNGWKVVPGGVDSCQDAAKCGVPKGTKLQFTIQYSVPTATQTDEMEAQAASWAQAGIKVSLTTATFNTVIANATACATGCSWEMEDWAGGWTYSPDYYPSGEVLFKTGAVSNYGSYSNAENDKLVDQTDFGTATLAQWENFLATNLPVVFQPEEAFYITEVQKNLHGVTPQNPLLSINPENWYFTK